MKPATIMGGRGRPGKPSSRSKPPRALFRTGGRSGRIRRRMSTCCRFWLARSGNDTRHFKIDTNQARCKFNKKSVEAFLADV